uniref:Uncharacterized protein n=1 Tax=Oryza sativa subsp. japonica TaxID=39947 RepID=Q6ZFM8_ORYSJ|nr:hypothetical protein [Oryza sativa Japonica Group]
MYRERAQRRGRSSATVFLASSCRQLGKGKKVFARDGNPAGCGYPCRPASARICTLIRLSADWTTAACDDGSSAAVDFHGSFRFS